MHLKLVTRQYIYSTTAAAASNRAVAGPTSRPRLCNRSTAKTTLFRLGHLNEARGTASSKRSAKNKPGNGGGYRRVNTAGVQRVERDRNPPVKHPMIDF